MLIKSQLVANNKLTSGLGNPCNYITIHETGNTLRGADAAAHARLQAGGNARRASWQWQVDDKQAIQSYPDQTKCWHASDGTGPGNMQSIGIEICVNRDGNYAKALTNAAILVRDLMVKHHIPLSRVVQHHHWSGKNCPTNLRRGNEWDAFKALIAGAPARPPRRPRLEVDASLGPATVTEWQRQRKTIPDGVISRGYSSLVKSVQVTLNRKNGKGGFRLSSGPMKVTGKFSSRDWKAIQKLLNVWGARKTGNRRISLKRPLKVTGRPDNRTVMALQKSLNKKLWK